MAPSFLGAEQRAFLTTISRLAESNPFLPERRRLEREALGDDYAQGPTVWSLRADPSLADRNVEKIVDRLAKVLARLRDKLGSSRPSEADLQLYEDGVLFLLYHRLNPALLALIDRTRRAPDAELRAAEVFRGLDRDLAAWRPSLPRKDTAHLFAFFFQLRRAFAEIYEHIIGGSMAAAQLRAAAWQSVFTASPRRYLGGLHRGMRDFTTLITGPSGSGKELVARAIARSQYVPFDPKSERFVRNPGSSFFALNLAALSPTLIESELFGHCRGAYTGAVKDRAGWLELCGLHGTVFLDEIGELEAELGVKLLRVLQTRLFQRLGETEDRRFEGKIVAATNRDLFAAMREGRFREDLYYRLCSDRITTPSLAEQLIDSPGELPEMVTFIVRRITGDTDDHGAIAAEVTGWIESRLGSGYPWPGNFRELEQCVRNVIIRKEYLPRGAGGAVPVPLPADLISAMGALELTADELIRAYCTLAVHRTGSYIEAARRLGLDRRTIKSRIDRRMLAALADRKGG